MTDKTYSRNILIDTPSQIDAFQGKGHERTAKSLAVAISQFENSDRSIGLDGPWGSGKSSIVEIATRELNELSKNGGKKFAFFTFDIWKSQGTAFRRAFLEHFVSWSIQNFPRKKVELQKIEEKIRGKTRHVTTNNNTTLDWYGVLVLLTLPFLPIFYFWAKKEYDLSTKPTETAPTPSDASAVGAAGDVISASEPFLNSAPMWVLYIFLLVTLGKAGWVYFSHEKSKKVTFWEALSRTLLITAKQYEKQQSTQHIREVDPNDFEFQATLSEIISTVQSPKTRVVLVLDNIDRLPPDQIDDHWSAIRSIFSRNLAGGKHTEDDSITAIVPYDRSHIQGAIIGTGDGQDISPTEGALAKRELFSKTFDEILFVAPPVMSNSREFFDALISEALPNFQNREELFRVYLIFSTYMKPPNGHFTPRQIISFINDLTNLFCIHEGKHPLSTVAVYTCHRERISDNPFILTNDSIIDAKLRRLAPDPEIEQNLAALLYNVDSQFALEILLDERISTAATQDNSKDLVELSQSHGFDLRVDEVIRSHAKDWIGAGEFGNAIINFGNLLPAYPGTAKHQVVDSLIYFFKEIPELSPDKDDYFPYFSLLDFCPTNRVSDLSKEVISKVLNTAIADGKGEISYSAGRSIIDFIDTLQSHLSDKLTTDEFRSLLKEFKLPSDPDFMLGVANRVSECEISLSDFGKVAFTLKEDDTKLEDFARDDYNLSEAAFGELLSAKVVTSQKWVETANSIIELLKDPKNVSTKIFDGLLGTLAKIWTNLGQIKRKDINLGSLSESAVFYAGLKVVYEHELEATGLGHAVFLVKHPRLSEDLPSTEEETKGTFTSEMKAAKQWFADVYGGETALEQTQVDRILENARSTRSVGSWVDAGRKGGDALIECVVRTAFGSQDLPRFALTTFLNNFDYSQGLVGDQFVEVLQKYDSYIDQDSVNELKLSEIPIGVLSDTKNISGGGWRRVHKKVEGTLLQTEHKLWAEKLENADHDVCLVAEMARSHELKLDNADFRLAFMNMVLKVLKGDITEFSNEINFDAVFEAIPESFHNDIFRQCREKVSEVSHEGLRLSETLFPNVLKSIVSSGEKISASEKDNVTRHLLCTALESGNVNVLNIFLSLGRRKVGDFINKSHQSTKDKVDGALAAYANDCDDRAYFQQVSYLVKGKKKTSSLWGIWFPHLVTSGKDEEEEAEDQR
ncbi:P-loop NTPase fold protein [Palleronia abyssalis]|uniref:KAP NTPase domain-containing protein n=1 Tax=Palleronia abyssalis TaxID=1501240 RepID=A0A2R8BWS5_9RHOB|nr:P-loop NTPase fold protein [Palleronia abyssalis]SPJ24582.1 hypothetical protein PAA8504_02416 [Palleronia abyssalis]